MSFIFWHLFLFKNHNERLFKVKVKTNFKDVESSEVHELSLVHMFNVPHSY